MATQIKKNKTRKIQMNITDKGLKEILELKEKLYATTMTEVIRSSLKLTRYLKEEVESGKEVIIRDKITGKEKVIVLP